MVGFLFLKQFLADHHSFLQSFFKTFEQLLLTIVPRKLLPLSLQKLKPEEP
jgi:hypothetical protein